MVNPGAFSGSRKVFLLSQKEYYAQAVNDGFVAEAISLIQRKYFNRYPIDIPHDQEPSEEHLAAVDDDAAIAEPEEPNPDSMSVEEFAKALARLEERQKLVLFRKAQIKRWLAYQYMKDLDIDPTHAGVFNPYRSLFFQLTGKKVNCPRQRSAANTWRKTVRETIEAEVKSIAAEQAANLQEGQKADSLITLRDRVAREMFKELSQEDQRYWLGVAIEDHKVAMREWKNEMEGKPGTDPKSRQIAIQGLVKFLQPILDHICEATGWKASFIAGGPEPAQGGLLNVLSIHSGKTTGDVKLSFGAAERERFRKIIVPLYGGFLQKCYTPEECRSRALRSEEGFLPLSQLDLEYEGVATDTISPTSALGTAILEGPSVSVDAVSGNSNLPVPTNEIESSQRTPNAEVSRGNDCPPADSPDAVRQDADTTTPVVQDKGDGIVGRLAEGKGMAGQGDEGAQGVEQEAGQEDDELVNPFPWDVPEESPLPSPCPSPRPETDASTVERALPTEGADVPPVPAAVPTEVAEDDNEPIPSASPRRSQRTSKVRRVGLPELKAPIGRQTRGREDSGDQNVSTNDVEMATIPPPPSVRRKKRGPEECEDQNASRNDVETASIPPPSARPAKRARVSASVPSAEASVSIFEVPSDAPNWFKKSFRMLSSKDLGGEWASLIEAWGRFESLSGYAGDLKVGAKNRPEAVKDWIQRARSATWRPNIQNVSAYGAEFTVWWHGIQPEWRILRGGKLLRVAGGDWEVLKRPGVNGLLSIAAGLFFWGCEAQKPSEKAQWHEMVVDFDYVLSQLLATI